MTVLEGLLVVIALSLNIFLTASYEGGNLRVLKLQKLLLVCLIFFLGQMVSMAVGYAVTYLPFVRSALSRDVRTLCYVLAAVLFLLIAAYMLFQAWKKSEIEERLWELYVPRIILEAVAVAVLTIAAGIGCALLGLNPLLVFLLIALITIAAVVSGLYMGYYQGARFRRLGFGISCGLFLITGVEVLVRYL